MSPIISRYQCQYAIDHITHVSPDALTDAALYERTGSVCTITLNRPERLNALNDAMFVGLMAALHKALLDPAVRVVVMRGAGRAFCVGHDFTSPRRDNGEPEETPPIPPELRPTVADYINVERRRCGKYRDIFLYPKPIVAVVRGACIGAGELMQAMCSFTLAGDSARFGSPGFGTLTSGIAAYETRGVGGALALRPMLETRTLTGKEAADAGMILACYPDDELDSEVEEFVQWLVGLPGEAVSQAMTWYSNLLDVNGGGLAYRTHYQGHVGLQWVRFRSDEVNFYKARREGGLSGYFARRSTAATSLESSS